MTLKMYDLAGDEARCCSPVCWHVRIALAHRHGQRFECNLADCR
jgi:hypothetical protein